MRLLILAVGLLAAGGCATSLPTDPSTAGNHPAKAEATTSPIQSPSQTLALPDLSSAEPLPPNPHQHVGPGSDTPPPALPSEHDTAGKDTPDMSHQHGTAAADAAAPTTQAALVYTCPMHAQERSPEPGRCPICHMRLVKKGGDE